MYWDSASRVLAEPAGIRTDPSTLQRPEGVLALDFVEGNVGIPGSTLPANAFSRYVGSPETTLNQDLWALGQGYGSIERLMDHLTQDLRGQPEGPGRRSGPKVRPDDLARAGMGSPFFPPAYLAVIGNEATDWSRGIKICRDSFSEDQNIEYHHIFPRKLLNQRGVDRYLRDEMANIAFLGGRANRRIRASAPKDYLLLARFADFLRVRRGLLAEAMNGILYT